MSAILETSPVTPAVQAEKESVERLAAGRARIEPQLATAIPQIFHLKFQRIQFTPDLMPADITGTEILQDTAEGRKMVFIRGPVFANMILADEINRPPPKTQAAP